MKYSLSTKSIAINEVVAFVASVAYPGAPERQSQKRVRERIRYHQKTHKLPLGVSFKPEDFFTWAINHWPALLSVHELPLPPVVLQPASSSCKSEVSSPELVEIAVDYDELKRRYIAAVNRYVTAEKAVESLTERLEACSRELASLTEKAARRSEAARAAGKQGGRGKTK